jgi:nucleotide-binding universal stress UspA family protein
MKILLAVDGSEYSRRAADYVAHHASLLSEPPEIFLLHVHAPIPFPGAAASAGRSAIDDYQKDESEAALAVAQQELRDTKLEVHAAWVVGDVAQEVANSAKRHGIDLVVVGSHGHGALANLALGSVATKIVASVKLPILIVR